MEKKKKIVYPDFWAKRKNIIRPDLKKELEDTANREPEVTDKYGEYKVGTFLHGCAIVTVGREDNLWCLHIYSERPIGLPLIREIRYKYLPDDALIAQVFGSREEDSKLDGIILCEVPKVMEESR